MDPLTRAPGQSPPLEEPAGARLLVAGIGNIFFGDDAFGVAVVRRLALRTALPGVRIVDFGIRGWDLVFALLEAWDGVILVDAIRRGGAPGTLYLIEVATATVDDAAGDPSVETHNLDPHKVLALARRLGAPERRVLLVGCEPLAEADAALGLQLSPAVAAALDEAGAMIESLAARLLEAGRTAGNHTEANDDGRKTQ